MKIQETLYEMKSQPVITAVSVTGTALAIFLIMVIVMMDMVLTEPFAPESNRDRWLVNMWTSIAFKDSYGESNGGVSLNTVREVYYRMKTPQEVTAVTPFARGVSLSIPGHTPMDADLRDTDDRFWRVMDFTFTDGRPYDNAEFESGSPVAVISADTARKLFGTDKAAGREISIDHVNYRVCGVVRDVSNLASKSYAQVWVPITSTNTGEYSWCQDIMGGLSVIILARSKADFPEIRREFGQMHDAYFKNFDNIEYIRRDRPYDQTTAAYSTSANLDPDMDRHRRVQLAIYAVLLLVPAINLSSMTHSRIARQMQTIGVRRAYGATRLDIMASLFIENLLITIAAGILGLALSVAFAYIASGAVFSGDFSVAMVLHWDTFGMALLFCLVLNIISAGVPSVIAARSNIVNALSGK